MVYRSTSLGLVALLERTDPVWGSKGMVGPCGQNMACLGSLHEEEKGISCEKWHMAIGLAFCGDHITLRKINWR